MRLSPPLKPSSICLALACLAAPAVHAASDSDITTTISGYGTVAGVVTDNSAYEFRDGPTKFTGVKNDIDTGLDSRFGLQGTMVFGPRFSVTAQALAMRRGSKDFDVGVEWMFGQLSLTDGLDLRLGRVVLPAFFVSDSRYVGYASTWLRAPVEIYGALPYSYVNGAQLLWQKTLGGSVVSAQVSHGQTQTELQVAGLGNATFKGRNVWNYSLSLENGDWTVRAAQTTMTVPVTVPTGPSSSVAHDNKDKFLNLGLQYDNGKAIVLSEWVKRSENNVPGLGMPVSATTAWYVAGGWRFSGVTPMLRYTRTKDNGGLISFTKQNSVGASVRYELVRNVALKAQVDRYDASNPSAFSTAAARAGTKVNVFGLGADFVF